jgi:hypothetical protein
MQGDLPGDLPKDLERPFGEVKDPSKALMRGRGNDEVAEQTDQYRTEDQVEDENGHWMVLQMNSRPPEDHDLIANEFSALIYRNFVANRSRRISQAA